MKEIVIILVDNLFFIDCKTNEKNVYVLEKSQSDKEYKTIIERINKNQEQLIILVTDKDDLFEYFNRKISFIKYSERKDDNPCLDLI